MTPEDRALLMNIKERLDRLERSDRYRFDKMVQFKEKVGFFGLEPVGKFATAGITLNMTVNGGTAVTEANGFSGTAGGGGTTYYTIGDIVRALKNYGLLQE